MSSSIPTRGNNNYFRILEKHLESGVYDVAACGKNAPTVEEVDLFAKQCAVKLPVDFVDFSVSRLGGLYVAVKEKLWPRNREFDVGPFWTFLYGLYVYGFAKDIPEFMDIRIQTAKFRESSGTKLLPCLKLVGDANVYGFDAGGSVNRWDHETGEINSVGKTFVEILDYELEQLADRKKRKMQERAAPR